MAAPRPNKYAALAGFKVGILMLETEHVLLPGNVQNASSFPFPVLYQTVEGLNFPQLASGDPSGDAPIKVAVLKLQSMGVSVIVGACGSFANWQSRIAQYAEVPVYASIMAQVPFVLAGLPYHQKLGVVFATKSACTPRVFEECNITAPERLVILGAEDVPSFNAFYENGSPKVRAAFRKEFVQFLVQEKARHPEIGAWLFQCSELPVYAAEVQQATGLPVYDQSLLIEHLHGTVNRRPYL